MQEEKKKRKGYATKEAQAAADKRYYHASEENRQRRLYISGRSQAKSFIKNRATLEDLDMLSELIIEERQNKMMKMIQKEEFIATVKKELQDNGDQMRVYLNGSIVNGYCFDNPNTNNELVVAKKTDELDDIEEFYTEYQSEIKKLHIKFTDVIDPLSIMAYDPFSNDYYYISKKQAENMEFVKEMISNGRLVTEKGIITEY